MAQFEPEPLLPGEGEGAAARYTVGESIMEYKARQLKILREIAAEHELDEDSEEYQEYLLDIKNNIEVMRLRLRNELDALKNPSRKPPARRARGMQVRRSAVHISCCSVAA